MLRSTIATALRRMDDPGPRRKAASGLLLGSVGLLGGFWLFLPTSDLTSPSVRDQPVETTTSALLSGPDRLVLPLPGEGDVHVATLLRHRQPDVEVLDATVINTDQVTTELVTDVAGATRLVVTSTAVHQCDRYAGSVIVTARNATTRRNHLFIDLRFADCDGVTAIPAAPSSVNDTSRTWGGDGLPPWYQPPQPEPQPPSTGSEPTADPTSEPTATAEPTTAPTGDPSPAPTPEPAPTAEPTSQPTSGGGGDGGGGGDSGGGGDGDEGTGSSADDTTSGSSTDTTTTSSGAESPDG